MIREFFGFFAQVYLELARQWRTVVVAVVTIVLILACLITPIFVATEVNLWLGLASLLILYPAAIAALMMVSKRMNS